MRDSLVVLGMDAMPPGLLEAWSDKGLLPNIAKLRQQGVYARQSNFSLNRTENSWLTFFQGCTARESGEWGHQDYEQGEYHANERESYNFSEVKPFFALGDARRVALFDLPLTDLIADVNGLQVHGWGTEVNQMVRRSDPPELGQQLAKKYGEHPIYGSMIKNNRGNEIRSHRIPSIYDIEGLEILAGQLTEGITRRTAICLDLLEREDWDLLLGVYAECHTALHLMWHLGQSCPLHDAIADQTQRDLMLDVIQAVDKGIGEIVERLPSSCTLMVFSPHGMQSNTLDLYSMIFLPELIYRWSNGQAALAESQVGAVPPLAMTYPRHWREEIWALRTEHGDQVLESPFVQEKRMDPLDWSPANWYQSCWPDQRAFVLPGYSEGMIRINVIGRDGDKGIAEEEFPRVCEELKSILKGLTDPRSGAPLVAEVIQVRQSANELCDQYAPPADLMVCWCEDVVTDVVEHADHGRIGPVPYFRTGGHTDEGFLIAAGTGFDAGVTLDDITTQDITATILDRLAVDIPAHVSGTPI